MALGRSLILYLVSELLLSGSLERLFRVGIITSILSPKNTYSREATFTVNPAANNPSDPSEPIPANFTSNPGVARAVVGRGLLGLMGGITVSQRN